MKYMLLLDLLDLLPWRCLIDTHQQLYSSMLLQWN